MVLSTDDSLNFLRNLGTSVYMSDMCLHFLCSILCLMCVCINICPFLPDIWDRKIFNVLTYVFWDMLLSIFFNNKGRYCTESIKDVFLFFSWEITETYMNRKNMFSLIFSFFLSSFCYMKTIAYVFEWWAFLIACRRQSVGNKSTANIHTILETENNASLEMQRTIFAETWKQIAKKAYRPAQHSHVC